MASEIPQRRSLRGDDVEREAHAVEEELEALKARYDQYFLGIERREPARWREELKKRIARLKGAFTRNSGVKFKIQSLHARYLSYERMWLRSAREKEEGTYRRDLFKARLRRKGQAAGPKDAGAARDGAAANEDAAAQDPPPEAKAQPAAKPAASEKPKDAARPAGSPPPLPAPGMSETQLRTLYNAYLAAKMTCREDVSKLTYEAVARTVARQIPELLARFKARSVEFKVEVKDGKAVLKAIPKV